MTPEPPDLPVIDPGMYAGIDPLKGLGEPEVVGAGMIRGQTHNMHWRHDLQKMELSYAIGERFVNNTPLSHLYSTTEGEDWVLHPYSNRLLGEDDQLETVYQFHARTRGGMSWCKTLSTPALDVLCFHHRQKGFERTRWLVSGDGLDEVFDWPELPENASFGDGTPFRDGIQRNNKLGIDAIARSDGEVYMVIARKRAESWIVRTRRDATEHAVEVATKDVPDGNLEAHDPSVPIMAYFLAWSVNEEVLYFTTIGDRVNMMGRVWFARVNEDGSLQTPEPFTQEAFPQPWGLAFDTAGNLWVASKYHVRVYGPDATLLGTLEVVTPEEQDEPNASTVTSIAFGGPTGHDLYVGVGTSKVGRFGWLTWNHRSGKGKEYTRGKLIRYKSAIPGAWRRRINTGD